MATTSTVYNDTLGGGGATEPDAGVAWETILGKPDMSVYALKLVPHTQSNLTIDFADGTYIYAEIGSNSSFSLSNVPQNQDLYINIKNTSGGTITIAMPNIADVVENGTATFDIPAGGYREFSLYYDGTTRFWQVAIEGEQL